MTARFTFAAVGHDEAATLPIALEHAIEAAAPGDHVWFVDSASTDDSADVARSAGATVITAPLGKGAAMATAIAECDDDFICFFDADVYETEHNIPRLLREVALERDVDMLVGAYEEPGRRFSCTPAVYRPLVGGLFPEVLAADITVPLSGFRVLRTGMELGRLPPGYGIETHLNVQVTITGRRVASCPVGWFHGNLRDYRNNGVVADDIAAAVLDLAVLHGRLASTARPVWDAWIAEAVDLLEHQPPVGADDHEFLEEVARLAARPLPPQR